MQNGTPEEICTPEQRALMLQQMQQASNRFYQSAIAIGCHPFIEFCGLMNEYIKLCQQAHNAGIDFTNTHAHSGHALPMQSFHAAYLGEKIGCIFGPALKEPSTRHAFLETLGVNAP